MSHITATWWSHVDNIIISRAVTKISAAEVRIKSVCVCSLSDIVDMCFCREINISIPVRLLDGSGNVLSRDGNSGIVKCGSKSVINGDRERERERECVCVCVSE
jgi:hypothetical protein